MASKKKRIIDLYITPTSFSFLFKKISGKKAEDYDFSGITDLRKLLSNERAKMLYVIKNQKPLSIYSLSKMLSRDFKAVTKDLKILERFGFVKLISERKGNRKTVRPEVEVSQLSINLNF
ncbi:MAG: HTH domain-containing protein [Nanoarchaeota archaeon]